MASGAVASGTQGAWLRIPDGLDWAGLWDSSRAYSAGHVVLYQDGDRLHAFVSRVDGNAGNVPPTSDEWSRLVQGRWNQ